ncbi:sulfate ABC transporter permease subunit CysT [Xanthobacter oligotrophicus]|uniref:sulfate ABC transporter permease subunit CysT n=1 Tax=Xanthobacter oligotrophicus TaxID=2607286 RepID=UPI0011F3CE4A|nr:sulfate ABC transporter permease subunit CysT [Xanthobacter oligotrophicus]MCG5237220.1 sulfate ABC transporter permease subunit CysT [Xanthobacter oligotrophicus]
MSTQAVSLRTLRPRTVIPGFGLTLGLTLAWLSLIVLLPLVGLFIKTSELTFARFIAVITSERTLHALQISFGLALVAALINAVLGLIVVWVLVRYEFPFRRVVDAIVDIPFALPTAVAGIALTAIYAENGWVGSLLKPFGIQVSFTPLGILVALIFIGLPFVVRTVQPVLADLNAELEEASASLGASRWQTIWRVVLPSIGPSVLTGFALAFARAVGEYGSVIFIAGNLPGISEIAPLLIVIRLEEFRYADATAIALVMLLASFLLLILINWLQRWTEGHGRTA